MPETDRPALPRRVAVATTGRDLDAPLDPRFGRAAAFVVYDFDSEEFTVVDNAQNLAAAQGAGIQAAETVARSGATALIAGHCGPKAFRVLETAGIAVYTSDAPTVGAALDEYRAGGLTAAAGADVDGHWL